MIHHFFLFLSFITTVGSTSSPLSMGQDEQDDLKRAALEYLRLRAVGEWAVLITALEADAEEAALELERSVQVFVRASRTAPDLRTLLLRRPQQEEVVRARTTAFHGHPCPLHETELRRALSEEFDLLQELRTRDLAIQRVAHLKLASEVQESAAEADDLAEDMLFDALEAAGPERTQELYVEHAEDWGHALRVLDPGRAEWWFGRLEADPAAIRRTFTEWEARDPELFAALRRNAGTGFALLELEIELHGFILLNDPPRDGDDAIERTVERVITTDHWPRLRALVEEMILIDLSLRRADYDEGERELRSLAQRLEQRAAHREFVVTAELMRRTERAHLLEW